MRLYNYAPHHAEVGGNCFGGFGNSCVSAEARRSRADLFAPFGWVHRNETNTFSVVSLQADGGTDPVSFHRAYVRLRQLPAANDFYFFRLTDNAGAATDLIRMWVESDGTIHLSRNNGAGGQVEVGTGTSALTLLQWYRLEVKLDILNPTDAGTIFADIEWRLDGVTVASVSNVSIGWDAVPARAPGQLNFGSVSFTGVPAADGCELDLSDLAGDDTDWVGGISRVTRLFPVAQGTYDEWIVDANRDWRGVLEYARAVAGAAPGSYRTDTASLRVSFLLETMTSRGITGALKSFTVMATLTLGGASRDWIIRRNGVDQFINATISAAGQTSIAVDASAWSPDDTIEVGIRNAAAGGITRITSIGAYIEHETPEPEADGAVRILTGSYVGTATQQTVDLGALDAAVATIRPDFVFINPATGGTPGTMWWDSSICPRAWNNTLVNAGILPMPGKFHIVGTDANHNQSGVTYHWLAVFDPKQRFIYRGATNLISSVDNRDHSLDEDPTFPIEALLYARDLPASATTNQNYFRGAGHVGDQTSELFAATAPIANVIQSMGVGTFQTGTAAATNDTGFSWMAFRSDNFSVNKLVAVTSYVGDGASPRNIPVDLGGQTPVMVLVVPLTTTARYIRLGGVTRQWTGGTTGASTAITGEEVDSIEVGATLNALGVTYSVLALAAGEDPEEAPEIEFTDDGFIGLTWSELTTKDAATHVWSKIALDDPSTYFHGFKDGRVLEWGRIVRSLSDRNGQMEGTDFSFRVSDNDRFVRALLAADSTKFFPNRPLVVRMIDDPSRRLLKQPRTIMRGLISHYKPLPRLEFSFTAQDVMTRQFAATNTNQRGIPKRTIELVDFPHANDPLVQQTAGTVQTVNAVGKGVPIIYGNVSDENIVVTVIPINRPGVDPDPDFSQPAQHANDASHRGGTLTGWIVAYILPYKSSTNTLGRIRGLFAGTYQDDERALSFRWEGRDDADEYWVFASDAGDFNPFGGPGSSSFVRRIIHDTVEDHPGDDRPFQQFFDHATDGDDWFNLEFGSTTISEDTGKGLVKPIYVGDYTINGTVWKGALLCGHALKSIVSGYFNDKRVDLATDADWLTPNNAAAWAAAGFATDYTDINGRRYTIVYVKGVPGETLAGTIAAAGGSAGITFNVEGIEDVGDGSGVLITNIHEQYKHLMINWVLGDYQGGAWATDPPNYPDDEDVPQLLVSSFDDASTTAAERIAGGYLGAGIIGPDGTFVSVRDLVAQFNQSADCDSGFNRKGQFFISMFTESVAAQEAPIILTDVASVNKDTFDVADDLESHFNQMPFFYRRDYSGRNEGFNGFLTQGQYDDGPSQTNYGAVLRAPDLLLEFVRDQATAEDVVQRRLLRMKDPPRIAKLATGLRGANFELGDIVQLTHYGGVGAAGWVGQPLRIQRHELNPNDYTVTVECMDLKQLFQTAFILGDETALPADWPSATAAQRIYGYLCDEVTGEFSDGEPGKRLR